MKCLHTICCLLPLSLPLLLLAGCQSSEDVTTYQVDRPQMDRLLGAIFLQKEGPNWFFKFVAPAAAVKDHEEEVAQLINSVRLEDKKDAVPAWELPKGWEEKAGGGEFRYKTLLFGAHKELELTVSRAGGNLLDNVNRWLGEEGLGLAPRAGTPRPQDHQGRKGQGPVRGPGGHRGRPETRRAPMGMGQGRRSRPSRSRNSTRRPTGSGSSRSSRPPASASACPAYSKEEPQVTISAIPGQWASFCCPNCQRWQKRSVCRPRTSSRTI